MRSILFKAAIVSVSLILASAACAAGGSPYVIDPPDVLRIDVTGQLKKDQPIQGQHLVRFDGTVGLGAYGSVAVSGLSVQQARAVVAKHLAPYAKENVALEVRIEVIAYNSKPYYVIVGEQVYPHPAVGTVTVVLAVLRKEGLAAVATKGPVSLTRRSGEVLKVDWKAITQEGKSASNYKLEAGDRLYVGNSPSK